MVELSNRRCKQAAIEARRPRVDRPDHAVSSPGRCLFLAVSPFHRILPSQGTLLGAIICSRKIIIRPYRRLNAEQQREACERVRCTLEVPHEGTEANLHKAGCVSYNSTTFSTNSLRLSCTHNVLHFRAFEHANRLGTARPRPSPRLSPRHKSY